MEAAFGQFGPDRVALTDALTEDGSGMYRKRINVLAFRTDDKVTFEKSWGGNKEAGGVTEVVDNKGGPGDWVIAGKDGDLYVISEKIFTETYERHGAQPHTYRKRNRVLARRITEPFSLKVLSKSQEGVMHAMKGKVSHDVIRHDMMSLVPKVRDMLHGKHSTFHPNHLPSQRDDLVAHGMCSA